MVAKAPVRVDVVLFDVGNVLIQLDHPAAFRAWSDASGESAEVLYQRFELTDAFKAHERGEITTEAYIEDFNAMLGVDLGKESFLQGWNAMLGDPVPGMVDLLSELSESVRLCGFSNTNVEHVAHWTGRYDELFDHLETLYVSNEIRRRKPELESYGIVAEKAGVSPEQILFLDDLAINIEGARRAGLQALQFTGAGDARAAIKRYL